MNQPDAADVRSIDRFLDGALQGEELAQWQRRCEAEPALRELLRQRRGLRAGFAAGRARTFAAPAGFAARVAAASRTLPVIADDGNVVRLCRRLLVAAAAAAAFALLWQSGLFSSDGDGVLEAAPHEVQRVLDSLDQRIRADGAEVRPR